LAQEHQMTRSLKAAVFAVAIALGGNPAETAGPRTFEAITVAIDRLKPPPIIAHMFCANLGFDKASTFIFLEFVASGTSLTALFRNITCTGSGHLADNAGSLRKGWFSPAMSAAIGLSCVSRNDSVPAMIAGPPQVPRGDDVMTLIDAMTATAALIAGLLGAGAAFAASFDCSKAATPTEHAICDNPQLSSLDEQTAGLYYTLISGGVPQATASIDAVKKEQAAFLIKRDACGANYNCLIGAYTAQIMYLKAASGQGM
jgi:uncharacterized protein YecT (DUF1311 family)